MEVAERFAYLGCELISSGRSTTEVIARIALAASIMSRLINIWRQQRVSLTTKLRLYNAFVVSVLVYGAETWSLLKSDERKLEAFHITCQRRILGVCSYNFVANTVITKRTGQESPLSSLRRRHLAISQHVHGFSPTS